LKILRFFCRLLSILGAGAAAYLISSGVFDFAMANLLHTENDPMRRASLEGTVGLSFSALAGLISAYFVWRMLNFRNPAQLPGK